MELAEESFLTDDFLRQLINIGEVDMLVGLPTHNNAKTIGSIVNTIRSGILQGFPRERIAIINVDAGSRDGTPALATGVSIDDVGPASKPYALRTLHSISTQCRNGQANGAAFRSILAATELLRAKACVLMSPESANIEPDWLTKFLRPIYHEGFDLVTPIYRRHKFEGLLMTNLLYPMTRALYGLRIREPYSPEFGFLRPPRNSIPWTRCLGRWNWRNRSRTPLQPGGNHRKFPHLSVLSGRKDSRGTQCCRPGPRIAANCRGIVLRVGIGLFRSGVPLSVPSRFLPADPTKKSFWTRCG